jgi:acyl-CoA reductase-like NAD-dependent aldehyde dehydrogenase
MLATLPTTMEPKESLSDEAINMMVEGAVRGSLTLKNMSAAERAQLARKCAKSCAQATVSIVDDTIKYKGSYETGRGEETIAWSATVGTVRELAETLEVIAASGPSGLLQQPTSTSTKGGRTKATVFPRGFYQHMLFSGYKGELWFKETPEVSNPIDNPAETWLLLGAGNQATVIGCDVAHLVFAVGCALVCKINPVNDYLKTHMEKAFAPLVELGIVQFCYGGISESQKLIHDSRIDGIHMTGSDKTYDIIQFGPKLGENPVPSLKKMIATNKKLNKLNLSKPFMAELGCSTPYIICPGKWNAADIDFHARAVVSMCVHNGHYNCLAAQNIIVSAHWPQRKDFVDAVRKHLQATQSRSAYYPGAASRLEQFRAAYAEQKISNFNGGKASDGVLPWTIIEGVSSDSPACNHTCRNEAWTALMTEIVVPSKSDADFLEQAVTFCNEKVWGTLSCAIFMPPDLIAREPIACEAAVANLKYGSVCVNAPTGLGYFVTACSWGGYIGHCPTDIQSGIGQIHNTLLFSNVEKSVIRAPWNSAVTPMWFHDNANHEALANAVVDFQASPNMIDFTRVALAAVRG